MEVPEVDFFNAVLVRGYCTQRRKFIRFVPVLFRVVVAGDD